jgi:DNA invertase Pin-like site-specific DNA recombinase
MKLDRLARSIRHLLAAVAKIEPIGAELLVTDQPINRPRRRPACSSHVLAVIAEFEQGVIRERLIAGVPAGPSPGPPLGSTAEMPGPSRA